MARFPHYLKSNRKGAALSQAEVSFLLGTRGEAKVSRYERFLRTPSLETALALEAIFQRPASELFEGLYQKVEGEVAARAKILGHRIDRGKPSHRTERRRQTITSIISKSQNQS